MDLNSPGSSHTQWLRKQFSSQDNRHSVEVGSDLLVDRAKLVSGCDGHKKNLDLFSIERNNIVNIW